MILKKHSNSKIQRNYQKVVSMRHNKVNPSNEHQTQTILETMEQKYQKLDMYTANMLTIINNTQPTQSEAMKYREYMRDIDNNIVTVLGDIITQYKKLKKICPYITCKIKMDIETIEKTKNIIQTTLNQGGDFDELEGILTQSLEDMQKKSANINNSLEVIKQSNLFDAINNLIKIYNNDNIEDIKNHIQSTYEKLETYLTNGRERSDQDKQQAFVKLYQIQNLLHILKDKISQNSDEKDTKDIM